MYYNLSFIACDICTEVEFLRMFHLIRLFYAYTMFLRSANEAHERRLLTNVEYILEGRFHTREQLNLLRQNCQRMPVMKTWHVAGAQSNTHRYHVYAYITSKTCMQMSRFLLVNACTDHSD